MPSFLKKPRHKRSKAAKGSLSPNVTPPTSTSTSTEQIAAVERIDWVWQIASIVKDASEGSPLLSPLKSTCSLIIRALEITRDSKQNAAEFSEITQSLERQVDTLENLVTKLESNDMRADSVSHQAFQKYLESIRDVLAETTKSVKPSRLELFDFLLPTRSTNNDKVSIIALKESNDIAFEDFFGAVLSITATQIEELVNLSTAVYEQIPKAVDEVFAQESSEEEYDHESTLRLLYGLDIPVCDPGTRIAVLDNIRDWANGPAEQKIYWLKDAAGTGKTTVAATLAREWLVGKRLAGRFFFTPNSAVSSGIDQFCVTVGRDLARQLPLLEATIHGAMEEAPTLGFHQQFVRIVAQPLESLELKLPLILVIDALDNCDPNGRKLLLTCLLEHLTRIDQVKVLLTSRPNPDIINIMSPSPLIYGKEVQLLDIYDTVLADMRVYVHNNLPKFTVEQQDQLVRYSGGLFIVAATACRLLRWNAEPAKLLNKLINADTKDHLDELYLEVLRQAVSDPTSHDMMMNVLQIIIVTYQPISINTIRTFLLERVEVDAFVQDLGAVLKDGDPDRPIKVLHPTFREFIAEVDRANGFLVNNLSSHALTAIGCLTALEKSLGDDILRIQKPHQVIPRNLDVVNLETILRTMTTAAVRYASSYWSYHVAASLGDAEVWSKTIHFLSTKLLNWLELMSWRGALSECAQGLSHLRIKTLRALQNSEGTFDISNVSHAYQFLLRHQPMIQDSALHTYSSALAFTPDSNPLFQYYRKNQRFRMPRIVSATPIHWSVHNVISGHTDIIKHVEFSPDGTRLATTSLDCSLILWDTTSGAIVGHPFQNATKGRIESLAFSPDSQQLVFSISPSKIHVWSAVDGQSLCSTMEAEFGEIVQIAFCPTWPHILSASADSSSSSWKYGSNTLQLWNTLSGQKVGKTMRLDGGARCFAASPDGSRVVCVSRRTFEGAFLGAVTFWSLESFSQLTKFDMPVVHWGICTRYSPKGNVFVTWDQLGTIYLCDGISGNEIARIKAHGGGLRRGLIGDDLVNVKGEDEGVLDICFSPGGDIFASSGKESPTIHLWNTATGGVERSLRGHSATINYMAFSQDGIRLASISLDQTVRVWNVVTGESMDSFFSGFTGDIDSPTLSADWSKLVTVSVNHQINLHDANSGTMHGNETTEKVSLNFAPPNVAFSPKGDIMVCGYADQNDTSTLGLWSIETGERVGVPMTRHSHGITSVAFSPDAALIATSSEDGTVQLWDGSTGHAIGDPFPLHDAWYTIFSPDSQLIACSSGDAIRVWSVHTGTSVWHLHRRTGDTDVAFSSDSTRLAGSYDDKICIWNLAAEAGRVPAVAATISTSFKQLAFGPKDDLLASYSACKIRLWSIGEELLLQSEFGVVASNGSRLGFSFDGKYLAYGSSLWGLSSLEFPFPLIREEQTAAPLDWKAFPHSLLTYSEGWIHSASPPGPLLPIPRYMWDQFSDWHAYGYKVVTWTPQRLPVIIDVSPMIVSPIPI